MELREPKRKRRVRISLQQPFPILSGDVTGIPTNKALWQVFTGKYSGDFVMVDVPDEMNALHSMGFFGKGSLSRGNPEFGKERQGTPPFIRHRQWKRRCTWAKQQEDMMKDYKKEQQETAMKANGQQDCVVEDQITSEVIVTTENEGSSRLSNNIIPEKKDSEKVNEVNDKTEKDDQIKINKIFEKTHNCDDSNVKKVHDVVNADAEIITLDSAEEDNGNKAVKDSASLDMTKNKKANKREQKSIPENINLDNTSEQNVNSGIKRKISTDIKCRSSKGDDTNVASEIRSIEDSRNEVDKSGTRTLLVLPDSDSDDEIYLDNICPRLEEEKFPIHEALHLTLEEAFFLGFGLGCLQVIDLFGNCLSLDGMWQLFCKSQKDFIQKYVTYHYFRSKGWVVKPGIKFGGDFLLYKQGPPFYHASYVVLVEVIEKSAMTRIPGLQRSLSWTRLMGLNRLGESAGKEILLCQVIWPSEAGPESMEFPSILSKFQVHEVLIRRWISSQEREENDVL